MLYNKKRTERKLQMEKEQLRDNRKKDYYRDVFFNDNVQFEAAVDFQFFILWFNLFNQFIADSSNSANEQV